MHACGSIADINWLIMAFEGQVEGAKYAMPATRSSSILRPPAFERAVKRGKKKKIVYFFVSEPNDLADITLIVN